MELLKTLFPDLTPSQLTQFESLEDMYRHWNAQINVISRKDIDQFATRHLLHSLALGLFTTYKPGSRVMDVGTGGGFPGIPLAILFPEVQFHLVDSIGKKIKVVQEVTQVLELKNVTSVQVRAEEVEGTFDYVVSRAVTRLSPFYAWVEKKIDFSKYTNSGFYALKGGDLGPEIKEFKSAYKTAHVTQFEIKDKLDDPFFETKKIVFIN
ncbi:MAG: 16S rRNA (guanine527-N7)-methyltransferase [Bacteroidia bacterium]